MTINKSYKWERYWCPADSSYSLSDDGFLVDPESSFGKHYNPNAVKFQKIPKASCLVFLGEPGIGKTKALEDAYTGYQADDGSRAVWVDLRSYSSDLGMMTALKANPEIQDWLKNEYQLELFLDSLDEGLLNLRTIAAVLIEILREWPRKRLKIRLACRTADWPKFLDTELCSLFELKTIPKYELLPLRKIDVITAAIAEGLEAEVFIKAIKNAEATSFAIRPITLNFLLSLFKKNGRLPEHKSRIYWQGCLQLCEETGDSRIAAKNIGVLKPAQRLIVASRVAAVMMFSNRSAVWLGPVNENMLPGDITIRELSGFSEEIDGISFEVSEDVIKDAISYGLFTSRGDQRMGFSHHTYLEYLAAYYLDKHQIPTDEIVRLIIHQEFGQIVPQLKGMAVWLASFNEKIFQKLVNTNPELLLSVDKAVLTINQKKVITKRLLKDSLSGNKIDIMSSIRYFDHLSYDGISNELGRFIKNRKDVSDTRLLAILIARECEVVGLLPVLISIALDLTEDFTIRLYAALTVAHLGGKETKLKLLPLASGTAKDDPSDEIKGTALTAVWPECISIEELLEYITPLKDENLIGNYYGFLYGNFIQGIQLEQLSRVLNWILREMPNLGSEVLEETIIRQAMLKAIDYVDNPEIAQPFSELAYKRLISHQEKRWSGTDKTYLDVVTAHVQKRKCLVTNMVNLLGSENETYYIAPLLLAEDIDWLINNIEETKSNNRAKWMKLLYWLVSNEYSQENLEKAYEIYEKYPSGHRIFADFFAPVQLNSEYTKMLRKSYLQTIELEAKSKTVSTNPANYRDRLLNFLEKFEQEKDTDAWWKLNLLIIQSDSLEQTFDDFEVDLTKFALWTAIDDQTKERIIAVANEYLMLRKPEKIWLRKNRISRPALAAFRAFYLLLLLEPQKVDSLPSVVWKRWANVIISFPAYQKNYDLVLHQSLIKKVIDHIDDKKLQVLLTDHVKKEYADIFSLIENINSNSLNNVLFFLLEDSKVSPYAVEMIIRFLLVRNYEKVKEKTLAIIHAELTNKVPDEKKAIVAAHSLIIYSRDAGWPEIGRLLKEKTQFGEKLFFSLAYMRHLAKDFVNKLSEDDIVNLYIWIESRFPEIEDPVYKGLHSVSQRENAGHFRNRIIVELANKGDYEACNALERIARRYPDKKWLFGYLRSCKEMVRRNTWKPFAPRDVLDLALNAAQARRAKRKKRINRFKYSIQIITLFWIAILPNFVDINSNPIYKLLANNQAAIFVILIVAIAVQVLFESTRTDK